MSTSTPEQLRDEAREQYEMDMQASYNSGLAEGIAQGIAQGKLELAQNLLAHGVAPEVIKAAAAFDDRTMAQLLETLEAERAAKKGSDDVERYLDSEYIELDRSDIEKQNMLDVAKSLLVQGVSLEVIKKAFGFDDNDMYELRRQQ